MLQSKQARDFDFDSGLLKQLLIRAIYLPLSYGKLEIKSIVKEEFKNDWYFYSIQKIVRKMSQNSWKSRGEDIFIKILIWSYLT